ncbi:RNA polymerase, sigma-24 subunit, ECF subfamily [Ruminiclostridium papyrosolvens DSM 2782]|uniref:RNA polymerase, sigma-24 subunit, ECF subfamily n=1 Tax=Ruminiclostridium papyrosolvens DSM 2782 TaxID=588581 RepID=F1THS6_9FIRM|nr:sigma-70 family RNA polymerase sigma factor [Ruminiclostridium papyrosolvens]EGD46058.1 RNA polymerase, sigma-24 subunit, ECF subfamily [Ruminiclostridium papyrosolvens DSM 2782]WES32858.1 sigma-70 family RNA polymerase sigma factor [Ruminiclostridium papyrosolvens DSM 2782]
MEKINENNLLQKARNGDVGAFEELTTEYYSKVYSICYRMLNNTEDAYEQAQETFIKAFKYIKDFKGNCAISTWLYRIATNVCLDFIRKHKNKKVISIEQNTFEDLQLKDSLVSENPGPEKVAETNAQKQAIKEAMDKMNEKNRLVIILRDFMGLSYDEISDTMKVPVGTVKSRINRARNELRELLCKDKEHLFTDYVK